MPFNIMTYSIKPAQTWQPMRIPQASTLFFIARANQPLCQKYAAGSRKKVPMVRPHCLCPYSIHQMNLNSERVIPWFFLMDKNEENEYQMTFNLYKSRLLFNLMFSSF